MSELKLISVELLYNYVECGDKLYITASWENAGDTTPDFNAQIVADIVFGDNHRLEATQCSNYSYAWEPFPSTNMWKAGDIWTTTGVWQVTPTWGGSYNLSLSLKDKSGRNIEFIGKNGVKTFSQEITEIDIGWGWGRPRLLEQRKPLTVEINPAGNSAGDNDVAFALVGGYKFNTLYPSVCGFEDQKWYDLPSVLTVRKISDSSTAVFVGDKGVKYTLNTLSENKACYLAQNEYCSFSLELEVTGDKLSVGITNISSKEDYELISLEIPSLVQLCDQNASLVNFFGGGRKVTLKDTLTQSALFYYDTCNALGTFSSKGSFAVVANDVDNVLRQSVVRKNMGSNTGVIGALIRVHIKASKAGLKSIPVKLKVLEIHHSSNEKWDLSAEILRSKLPENYEKLYENTLLYKIRMDASGQYNPEKPETYSPILTLADTKKIIMQVHNISAGMRQVVYLVGWQKGGHDFEYPYPYLSSFNPECGTIEEFNALREELKQYNVELSLHDNFDDAYLSDAYEIKEEMLAFGGNGNYWKGWLWAGGMSYIISPTAYLKTKDISERIEAAVRDYGIEGTYHLDVLSSEVRRYSFAQNELSCAEDNINGKIGIIELFNKKGIDITSETLAMPFIGKIGYAQNTRYNFGAELFSGEKIIPLTTVAFHGITPYKMGADGSEVSMLRAIACGASCSIEIEENTEDMTSLRNMARNIYSVSLPMSALSYKKALSANIKDSKWTIEYEDDSYVTVDFEQKTYAVVDQGKTISENFTTFMPVSDKRYCYYSLHGGKTELKLPDDWDNAKLISVCADGKTDSQSLKTENGIFTFEAQKDVPYIFEKLEG